jgi:hypothetical protein
MRAAMVLLLFAPAWGQVSAPLLGFLPEGNQLRPIFGVPAAATVGDPIRTGVDVGSAISARDSVLIVGAEGGVSVLVSGTLKHVAGTRAAPVRTALSPAGQAAVLWFTPNSTAQVLSNIAGTPVLREVNTSFLGAAPSALAVSDDGTWMAGIWADGTYAFGPQGEVLRLPLPDAAVAIEFFPASYDLGLATARGLWLVADVGGRTALRPLWQATPEESFDALAVGGGVRQLHAVTRDGVVLTVPLEGNVTRLDCQCQPLGLPRLGGNAFRLTGPVNGAIKLFDADSGAVWFAPIRPADSTDRLGGRSR